MSKFTAPCAVLLALAATFASLAQAAQPDRCPIPVAAQKGDPSLDQLASDARAVWHELSPEVREMVDEMLASRDKRNPIATMARSGCDVQPFSAARPLPGRAASATRPA